MADDFDEYLPPEGDVSDQKQISLTQPFRLGIVGHGFVGRAVEYAFTHPLVDVHIADPKYDTTIDDMIEFQPSVVFVCAPTPQNEETGFVDASIVEDSVLKLMQHTDSLVVVKSTVTPDIVDRLYASMEPSELDRFVYNPEFLTEKSAEEDFVNATHHIMGGTASATSELIEIYDVFSLCQSSKYYRMSACEASFVKYATNAYLATKVTFFNQMYDLVNAYQCSYNVITRAMGEDDRVGIKHTRVPGPDRKRGFGGACLPKDTMAFLKFSEGEDADGNIISFDLLEKVLTINNKYRSMYELSDREKVNNITFEKGEVNEHNGQTEEELETQDNGSTVGE